MMGSPDNLQSKRAEIRWYILDTYIEYVLQKAVWGRRGELPAQGGEQQLLPAQQLLQGDGVVRVHYQLLSGQGDDLYQLTRHKQTNLKNKYVQSLAKTSLENKIKVEKKLKSKKKGIFFYIKL